MQAHEAIIEEREVEARLNRAREAREKADKVNSFSLIVELLMSIF